MALDFPSSPTVGQVFQSWMWDGTAWGPLASGGPYLPLAGGTVHPGPLMVNANVATVSPTGNLEVVASDGSLAREVLQSFGGTAPNFNSQIVNQAARGTAAAPTPIQADDNIATWEAWAYNGSNYNVSAYMVVSTTETVSAASGGAGSIGFWTAAPGTTNNVQRLVIGRGVTVGNVADEGPGSLTTEGNLTSMGDIVLGRTSNAIGYLLRPNVAGFRNLNFAADGATTLDSMNARTGSFTIDATYANTNDPLGLAVAGGLYCRVRYAVSGVRLWSAGVGPTGQFLFADESGASVLVAFNDTAQGSSTQNTSGSWATFSSQAYKQNINPYPRGLEAILALNPISFEYNADAPIRSDGTFYGLIAEDTAPIVPEAVDENMVFTPGVLIYVLINAVKELAARVDELEARP